MFRRKFSRFICNTDYAVIKSFWGLFPQHVWRRASEWLYFSGKQHKRSLVKHIPVTYPFAVFMFSSFRLWVKYFQIFTLGHFNQQQQQYKWSSPLLSLFILLQHLSWFFWVCVCVCVRSSEMDHSIVVYFVLIPLCVFVCSSYFCYFCCCQRIFTYNILFWLHGRRVSNLTPLLFIPYKKTVKSDMPSQVNLVNMFIK